MAIKLNTNSGQYVYYVTVSSALPVHYGASGTGISENEQVWESITQKLNVQDSDRKFVPSTKVSIERISGAKYSRK